MTFYFLFFFKTVWWNKNSLSYAGKKKHAAETKSYEMTQTVKHQTLKAWACENTSTTGQTQTKPSFFVMHRQAALTKNVC